MGKVYFYMIVSLISIAELIWQNDINYNHINQLAAQAIQDKHDIAHLMEFYQYENGIINESGTK